MAITVKSLKAIVLAAGLGQRLRPLTLTTPKPLVTVGNKRLIDWALDLLEEAGVSEAVVNTSYLYAQVEGHLAGRAHPHVTVSRELPVPLETGGGIAKALPLLGDAPFLVLNSDTICLNGPDEGVVARLMNAWNTTPEIDFLMLLQPLSRATGFYGTGDFILGEDGSIRRPEAGEDAPYVFTGIELIHPRAFTDIPDGPFSLNVLWNRLRQENGWYSRIRAIVHDGDWLHVGDAQGLQDVEQFLSEAQAS
jgi:MurNAc alpha-1-phosphate uridylyltransferase